MAGKRPMADVRTNPYPIISSEPRHEIHANNQTLTFRASPWVSYDPTSTTHQEMDQDVDMDAPQISVLDDNLQPTTEPSARDKKSKKQKKEPPTWTRPRPQGSHTDDEYDEVDEPEEDQLIDDDDMKPITPSALSASARATDTKKKTPGKRKPRKSEKGEKPPSGHDVAPTMSWFEANPDATAEGGSVPPTPSQLGEVSDASKPATPVKVPKKSGPKPKEKAPAKLKNPLPILADDVDMGSEAGQTGTAASSPVTGPAEPGTPEPEGTEALPPPVEEPINLENVPLPIYPLPSKPFPVQPPPKIQSGFAPAAPLDKTGKKVRHWRVAQREIRGIGGGRWFVRSWVGEQESAFGAALAASKADEKSTPTAKAAAGGSISAPVGKGTGKKSKAASLAASAAPSRSGSSVPDAPPATVRAPTKMRNIIGPPSEAGDSDVVPSSAAPA